MATAALRQEVDELREFLKELGYQSMRTELSINRLSQEMREFKEEIFPASCIRRRRRRP
jgi:hypothetical protein